MCMAGITFPLRLCGSGRLAHSAAMSGPEPAENGVPGLANPHVRSYGRPRHEAPGHLQRVHMPASPALHEALETCVAKHMPASRQGTVAPEDTPESKPAGHAAQPVAGKHTTATIDDSCHFTSREGVTVTFSPAAAE